AATHLRTWLSELSLVHIPSVLAIPKVEEAITKEGKTTNKLVLEFTDALLGELVWFARAIKTHAHQIVVGHEKVTFSGMHSIQMCIPACLSAGKPLPKKKWPRRVVDLDGNKGTLRLHKEAVCRFPFYSAFGVNVEQHCKKRRKRPNESVPPVHVVTWTTRALTTNQPINQTTHQEETHQQIYFTNNNGEQMEFQVELEQVRGLLTKPSQYDSNVDDYLWLNRLRSTSVPRDKDLFRAVAQTRDGTQASFDDVPSLLFGNPDLVDEWPKCCLIYSSVENSFTATNASLRRDANAPFQSDDDEDSLPCGQPQRFDPQPIPPSPQKQADDSLAQKSVREFIHHFESGQSTPTAMSPAKSHPSVLRDTPQTAARRDGFLVPGTSGVPQFDA
ncbi:hypothetical protein BV898_20330, partial [Hypsibius exemplaris]